MCTRTRVPVDHWVLPSTGKADAKEMSQEMPFSAKIPASLCVRIMICRSPLIRCGQFRSNRLPELSVVGDFRMLKARAKSVGADWGVDNQLSLGNHRRLCGATIKMIYHTAGPCSQVQYSTRPCHVRTEHKGILGAELCMADCPCTFERPY